MKAPTHARKDNVIRVLEVKDSKGNVTTPASSQTFKSINAAKRHSRELQKKGAVMRVDR